MTSRESSLGSANINLMKSSGEEKEGEDNKGKFNGDHGKVFKAGLGFTDDFLGWHAHFVVGIDKTVVLGYC